MQPHRIRTQNGCVTCPLRGGRVMVCGSVCGVFWRLNWWRWSSFRRDPAKRAVLTLGDSPARCTYAPAAPIAVDTLLHAIPKQGTLAGHHLPASSQSRRRTTCTSAKTGIGHNAEFCVLTTSRQGQASPTPPPAAYITRNSSHKPEFHIRTKLCTRLRRGIPFVNWEQQSSLRPALFERPTAVSRCQRHVLNECLFIF